MAVETLSIVESSLYVYLHFRKLYFTERSTTQNSQQQRQKRSVANYVINYATLQ